MSGNLGRTSLRRRHRATDPMRAYDALPRPLRRWLAEACLPWSPASCRRIWLGARSRGETMDTVLARLDRAQARIRGHLNYYAITDNIKACHPTPLSS